MDDPKFLDYVARDLQAILNERGRVVLDKQTRLPSLFFGAFHQEMDKRKSEIRYWSEKYTGLEEFTRAIKQYDILDEEYTRYLTESSKYSSPLSLYSVVHDKNPVEEKARTQAQHKLGEASARLLDCFDNQILPAFRVADDANPTKILGFRRRRI